MKLVGNIGYAFFVVTLLPMTLSACSTGGQKLTQTGFLLDYAKLEKPAKIRNAAVWVSPAYHPEQYRKVVIAPVEWHAPRRDAKVEAMLKLDLRERLVERLSGRYQIVEAGDADLRTLRVRTAITGMRRTRWYLNVPLQAAQMAVGGLGLFGPLRGGGSEEMQIEDAQSGSPVIQLATFHNGKPWNFKGAYVPYDHARGAFTKAALLATRVMTEPTSAAAKPVQVKPISTTPISATPVPSRS